MSAAATDRLVTRRRSGNKVGALQRRVRELRVGVCSARTCTPMAEELTRTAKVATLAHSLVLEANTALNAYREDAPHVVAVLDVEKSFLRRVWFALGFVLFGLARKEVPQW